MICKKKEESEFENLFIIGFVRDVFLCMRFFLNKLFFDFIVVE